MDKESLDINGLEPDIQMEDMFQDPSSPNNIASKKRLEDLLERKKIMNDLYDFWEKIPN